MIMIELYWQNFKNFILYYFILKFSKILNNPVQIRFCFDFLVSNAFEISDTTNFVFRSIDFINFTHETF